MSSVAKLMESTILCIGSALNENRTILQMHFNEVLFIFLSTNAFNINKCISRKILSTVLSIHYKTKVTSNTWLCYVVSMLNKVTEKFPSNNVVFEPKMYFKETSFPEFPFPQFTFIIAFN